MATLTAASLHIAADDPGRAGAFAALDAKRAGWDTMNFAAIRLGQGKTFEIAIDAFEYVAVVLGGRCNIRTNKGDFDGVGRRDSVFGGLPYAVYLPPGTEFEIESLSDNFEFASCWTPSARESQPRDDHAGRCRSLALGRRQLLAADVPGDRRRLPGRPAAGL